MTDPSDGSHRYTSRHWWLLDARDADRIARQPDSIQDGWDRDAEQYGPDGADALFDAENPDFEPPPEFYDEFDAGDTDKIEPDLAARLADLHSEITGFTTSSATMPGDDWDTIGRQQAAERLTERGADVAAAREMVTDYLRETSELVGVPVHEWGLDQGDVESIAADHRLSSTGDDWTDDCDDGFDDLRGAP